MIVKADIVVRVSLKPLLDHTSSTSQKLSTMNRSFGAGKG